MSLPIILEVAIGLVFVYLTLSLLASEIQEILGTLLQWRAEHLKRSIEVLLAGSTSENQEVAMDLADQLYKSPLIRSLNQEATGSISKLFRLFNHFVGRIYRFVTQVRNVFGSETSGPSYIPSSTFAQSLIEHLQLDNIRSLLVEARLQGFAEEKLMLPIHHIVNDLRASTSNEFLLNAELRQLELSISQIVEDFKSQRSSLTESLDRLIDRLDDFTQMAQEVLPDNHHLTETFIRRLSYLKRAISKSTSDKVALIKKIRPRLEEVISVLDHKSQIHQEFKTLANKGDGIALDILERLQSQALPQGLERSLNSLAQKAQSHIADLEEDISPLAHEVESWFDHSMERAGGVYRRNARAVAFLIGLGTAISLNADSLHMLERFSNDPTIRQTIAQSAEQLVINNPDAISPEQMKALQSSVDENLNSLPLPIGYQEVVVEQQRAAEKRWSFPIPRRLIGWLITGVAISMGSSFWFDLLKKFVGVKNSSQSSS